MILYTFQPKEAVKVARKVGYFTCDEEHARDAWDVNLKDDTLWDGLMKRPYEFMRRQMAKRLPNYTGEYPIWAYVEKLDLRCCRAEYKYETVLMTIDVPDERVLISDFDGWHFVMNNGFFSISEKEDEEMENATQRQKEKSWERIFDLDLDIDEDWLGGEKYLQACVDRVYLHEVKTIKQLKPWG